MTDPLAPSEPNEETVKARGRGVSILLVIRPSIGKKDIHHIRQSMERALFDSFESVELSYYPRDPISTHLKIVADLAKFRLDPADVVPWYARLLERFLRQFQQDLKELQYSIDDIQVMFLTRPSPREKEGDLIPVPTPEETSALLPGLARMLAPPAPDSPTIPEEAARTTESPSVDITITGKLTSLVPWLERDLTDPEECPYRTKALQEYREDRFDEGVQTCVSGLELYPNSPFLLYILGTLLISQKKDREALSILDHLITVHPDFAEAYLQRSKVLFRIGDVNGAEQDRAKARGLNPDLVDGE
jgi:tetratricopeptide (TPR) repeat protein